MGFLTDYQKENIEYNGRTFYVNASFDAVLNIQRLYRNEPNMSDIEKMELSLDILVEGKIRGLNANEKAELLNAIYDNYITVKERPSSMIQRQKVLDFEEDGEYIYASFMQDYGIDLIEQQGTLSFKKFIALFDGLSEKTKIKEVMRIRGMEIPSPNKNNQKEIKQITELKLYYALTSNEGSQSGIDNLFSTLERMAVRNGK